MTADAGTGRAAGDGETPGGASDAGAAGGRTASDTAPDDAGTAGGDTGAGERITVRLVMPDRWLEQVEELPLSATVEEAKALGLRTMLQRDTDDPDQFYVEYAERQVPDETVTLGELGVQPREILSIRAYDLGHYPRFEG